MAVLQCGIGKIIKFMFGKKLTSGFTLVEAVVAAAIFLLFAVGVYGGLTMVFKIVYQSRIKILETAILSQELEIARNLPYDQVGIINGSPIGLLPHTKVVTLNNVNFSLVTTVRNIDDPFDGTIGGSPNDTSPADYKLVEMSAICIGCNQQKLIKLSTIVSPRQLEGASTNGALFIQVFDQEGLPVSGADVHVVNTDLNPNLIIDDTTDSSGYLRIVDTPTGTLAYNITVSKSGYSSDYTIAASESNPSPVKPPSNVVAQNVTDIAFSIDELGSINFHSVSTMCAAIPNVGFNIKGAKMLGVDPDVYKYDQNFTTDESGDKTLSNIEFDNYHLTPTALTYDIAGTIPAFPLNFIAGASQEVTAVLKPHTANSLLVKVFDAGTGLPLSDATVHVTGSSYDTTILTGVGYLRQTDWTGTTGQVMYIDESRYFANSGTINGSGATAGNVKLKKASISPLTYISSGNLESSTFDFGSAVTFRNLVIDPLTQVAQTGADSLKFQLATSNSSTPVSWNFVGPDGTASTYFTASNNVVPASLSDNRYLRYKAYLSTNNNRYTPILSEIAVTYTVTCAPPGQAFFSGLAAASYTVDVSRSGYAASSGSISVSGNLDTFVNLSPL